MVGSKLPDGAKQVKGSVEPPLTVLCSHCMGRGCMECDDEGFNILGDKSKEPNSPA
jgi:hypothetical protein